MKECNRGSDDEHNRRKMRKHEQLFSTLLDKQDKKLKKISKLKECFEMQADNLLTDNAQIL